MFLMAQRMPQQRRAEAVGPIPRSTSRRLLLAVVGMLTTPNLLCEARPHERILVRY